MSKSRLSASSERANPVVPVHVWRGPADAPCDVRVHTELSVYADIDDHSRRALPNETGGFLLGHVWSDASSGAWIVHVDEAVPVTPATQTPVHFTFTWRDVDRVRGQREASGKALVGWYHTHPGMDIFLSETDLEKTHRLLFSDPFQVALVYDPIRSRAGYFFWEERERIDAAAAPWREFQIALEAESPPVEEPPPTPVVAPAPVEIVASPAERQPAPAGVESSLATQFRTAAASATGAIPKPAAKSPETASVEPPPVLIETTEPSSSGDSPALPDTPAPTTDAAARQTPEVEGAAIAVPDLELRQPAAPEPAPADDRRTAAHAPSATSGMSPMMRTLAALFLVSLASLAAYVFWTR